MVLNYSRLQRHNSNAEQRKSTDLSQSDNSNFYEISAQFRKPVDHVIIGRIIAHWAKTVNPNILLTNSTEA